MGYRSDIRIKIRKEDYYKLVASFNEKMEEEKGKGSYLFGKTPNNEEEIKDNFNSLEGILLVKPNETYFVENEETFEEEEKTDDMVYFGWDSLKWYDGFEDVDFIMNFIRNLPTYAYARIGEESGDVEQESRNLYDIEVYNVFGEDEDEENNNG